VKHQTCFPRFTDGTAISGPSQAAIVAPDAKNSRLFYHSIKHGLLCHSSDILLAFTVIYHYIENRFIHLTKALSWARV